jgi:DHA1 family bicyclomycin/chloramphenicol resistance-like MFS transporter
VQVVSNVVFVRYTLIATLLFTALSSYVASSEHIVGEIYGRPELFAWIFAGIGLVMSICSFMNSHLSSRFGARQSIRWLLIIYTLIAGVLLVFTFLSRNPPDIRVFFVGIGLLLSLNLAVEPNSSALALEPMGETAGLASAVYGTVFFFFGASLGAVISWLMVTSVFPLVISFFIFGVFSVLLVVTDRRRI